MALCRLNLSRVFVTCCILGQMISLVFAQDDGLDTTDWESRVLKRRASTTRSSVVPSWSQADPQVRLASAFVPAKASPSANPKKPLPDPGYDDIQLEPILDEGQPMPSGEAAWTGMPSEMACDTCDPWAAGGYRDFYDPCYGLCGWFHSRDWGQVFRNFSFFAGIHGFKGPVDQGKNGNFGFHEGLNYGAPLGDPWGMGYQLGVQVMHSDLSGDQVIRVRRGDRNQVFFTGGIFRRAVCGGLQWGIAFDLLRDTFYEKATLSQLRTEMSWVLAGDREYGFWGSFGTKNDEIASENGTNEQKVTDLFAFFCRRYFSGGGEGRLWTGFTGGGDALFGGDIRVPLGTSWALENDCHYLIPKQGRGADGSREETWSVNINLVWYPGRSARCVRQNPYHPLFNVANNSVFMVDLNTDH